LRSFNTISFTGGSNVDLRSENDFIIDSILNTVSVSATSEGAGYTGYHVLFDSDILTVSGSDAFFVTKGSVQFVDSKSNKLNFNTATFAADNANRFYTYHDLPITVSTLLNIQAPRVELRSSDHITISPGNDVVFSTTKGTGDVHFQSPSFTFTGTGTSQIVNFAPLLEALTCSESLALLMPPETFSAELSSSMPIFCSQLLVWLLSGLPPSLP